MRFGVHSLLFFYGSEDADNWIYHAMPLLLGEVGRYLDTLSNFVLV